MNGQIKETQSLPAILADEYNLLSREREAMHPMTPEECGAYAILEKIYKRWDGLKEGVESNSVVDAVVSKNTEDNSETAIVQRCYDLIENIEQQCADYRKIVKDGKQAFMEKWNDEYMKSRFCSFEDNVRIGNWMRKNL